MLRETADVFIVVTEHRTVIDAGSSVFLVPCVLLPSEPTDTRTILPVGQNLSF